MATQVKTKFIEKTHERVWNISDHPKTKVLAQAVMVAGQTILPGRSIKVPLDRMENPKKLQKAVDAGLIVVGEQPPADYLLSKGLLRAHVKTSNTRSHGERVKGGGKKVMEDIKSEQEAKVKDAFVKYADLPAEEQPIIESKFTSLSMTKAEPSESKKGRHR
jgi:hypothetical protein